MTQYGEDQIVYNIDDYRLPEDDSSCSTSDDDGSASESAARGPEQRSGNAGSGLRNRRCTEANTLICATPKPATPSPRAPGGQRSAAALRRRPSTQPTAAAAAGSPKTFGGAACGWPTPPADLPPDEEVLAAALAAAESGEAPARPPPPPAVAGVQPTWRTVTSLLAASRVRRHSLTIGMTNAAGSQLVNLRAVTEAQQEFEEEEAAANAASVTSAAAAAAAAAAVALRHDMIQAAAAELAAPLPGPAAAVTLAAARPPPVCVRRAASGAEGPADAGNGPEEGGSDTDGEEDGEDGIGASPDADATPYGDGGPRHYSSASCALAQREEGCGGGIGSAPNLGSLSLSGHALLTPCPTDGPLSTDPPCLGGWPLGSHRGSVEGGSWPQQPDAHLGFWGDRGPAGPTRPGSRGGGGSEVGASPTPSRQLLRQATSRRQRPLTPAELALDGGGSGGLAAAGGSLPPRGASPLPSPHGPHASALAGRSRRASDVVSMVMASAFPAGGPESGAGAGPYGHAPRPNPCPTAPPPAWGAAAGQGGSAGPEAAASALGSPQCGRSAGRFAGLMAARHTHEGSVTDARDGDEGRRLEASSPMPGADGSEGPVWYGSLGSTPGPSGMGAAEVDGDGYGGGLYTSRGSLAAAAAAAAASPSSPVSGRSLLTPRPPSVCPSSPGALAAARSARELRPTTARSSVLGGVGPVGIHSAPGPAVAVAASPAPNAAANASAALAAFASDSPRGHVAPPHVLAVAAAAATERDRMLCRLGAGGGGAAAARGLRRSLDETLLSVSGGEAGGARRFSSLLSANGRVRPTSPRHEAPQLWPQSPQPPAAPPPASHLGPRPSAVRAVFPTTAFDSGAQGAGGHRGGCGDSASGKSLGAGGLGGGGAASPGGGGSSAAGSARESPARDSGAGAAGLRGTSAARLSTRRAAWGEDAAGAGTGQPPNGPGGAAEACKAGAGAGGGGWRRRHGVDGGRAAAGAAGGGSKEGGGVMAGLFRALRSLHQKEVSQLRVTD